MDAADWDARYAATDLVWSATPNVWVEEIVSGVPAGQALDLAAGEGRNAIWLVEQGWTVTASDFSPVAAQRMADLAAERLGPRVEQLAVLIDDVTAPSGGPGGEWVGGQPGWYDLVLLCYLQLPEADWRAAITHAVGACRPGGAVLVVSHALRNLEEGVGGPQDPAVLLDPEGVIDSVAGLPVTAELAEIRERRVDGTDRPALDTVVLLRRD